MKSLARPVKSTQTQNESASTAHLVYSVRLDRVYAELGPLAVVHDVLPVRGIRRTGPDGAVRTGDGVHGGRGLQPLGDVDLLEELARHGQSVQ